MLSQPATYVYSYFGLLCCHHVQKKLFLIKAFDHLVEAYLNETLSSSSERQIGGFEAFIMGKNYKTSFKVNSDVNFN